VFGPLCLKAVVWHWIGSSIELARSSSLRNVATTCDMLSSPPFWPQFLPVLSSHTCCVVATLTATKCMRRLVHNVHRRAVTLIAAPAHITIPILVTQGPGLIITILAASLPSPTAGGPHTSTHAMSALPRTKVSMHAYSCTSLFSCFSLSRACLCLS